MWVVGALGVAACGAPTTDDELGEPPASPGKGDQPGAADGGEGGGTGGSTPDKLGTGGEDESDETGEDDEDTAGFVLEPDLGEGPELALGEQCGWDSQCASGRCFFVVEGSPVGLCSDCATDDECFDDAGVGTCSFVEHAYAECTDGSAGFMCHGAGCAGDLVCADVWAVSVCSECSSDADCSEGDTFCAPTFDTGMTCLTAGVVDNDVVCAPEHPEACASTHCTEALYGDTPTGYFVCGECSTDGDCEVDETCVPAAIDSDVAGSFCL